MRITTQNTGCLNCLARRLKCDRFQPSCHQCLRNKMVCSRPAADATRKRIRPCRERPTRPLCGVQQADDEPARAFFFFHYFSLGRQNGPSRHAFDLLETVIVKEPRDSPMSLAFTAASLRMWYLWRDRSSPSMHRIVFRHLLRALSALQRAVNDPEESKKPGTVLAAFILQFDETNSAIAENHEAVWVHHKGAMALAQYQLAASKNPITATLLHNVFQVEVSYALRNKVAVPPDVVNNSVRSGILQDDAITKLDMIGVDIAKCQRDLVALPPRGPRGSNHARIYKEATAIRARLAAWPSTVPQEWHPLRLDQVKQTEPPIITYSGGCYIYPSVQIADLWNTWRCRHLILLDIILRTLPGHKCPSPFTSRGRVPGPESLGARPTSEAEKQAAHYIRVAQGIVDDVCDTYPFFLGNVSRPVDYSDLSSPLPEFPSLHDLDLSSEENIHRRPTISRQHHVQHAMTQGPWFAVTFLTYLITLLSSSDSMLGSALRPGQFDWLFHQFRRILTLWHVDRGDWSSVDFIRERMRYTTSI